MSDSIGKVLGNVGNMFTLGFGAVGDILGIQKPDMPAAPEGPSTIQTGQTVKAGGVESLNADTVDSATARKTATKGAAAYRIPLAKTKAGVATGGGAGLKI